MTSITAHLSSASEHVLRVPRTTDDFVPVEGTRCKDGRGVDFHVDSGVEGSIERKDDRRKS